MPRLRLASLQVPVASFSLCTKHNQPPQHTPHTVVSHSVRALFVSRSLFFSISVSVSLSLSLLLYLCLPLSTSLRSAGCGEGRPHTSVSKSSRRPLSKWPSCFRVSLLTTSPHQLTGGPTHHFESVVAFLRGVYSTNGWCRSSAMSVCPVRLWSWWCQWRAGVGEMCGVV